jgi:Ca2+-binding RTX toxin-like protein
MAEKKKARGIKVVATSVAMVAVGSGAAFAATIPGTDAGEALHGTRQVGRIYGYGGADSLYGGNEAGWVDRILGGSGGDRPRGQNGTTPSTGRGAMTSCAAASATTSLAGGRGEDVLDGGPGADEIDARRRPEEHYRYPLRRGRRRVLRQGPGRP